MEGGPRVNPSSDLINAIQACILATQIALQEAPLIGTCRTNTPRKETQNIKEKAATTALNALQLLFLPHLCGEDL